MWNLFRLVADFLHLASFLILILKIRKSKNCLGLSCKTQELYLLVFCSRYLDLFYSFSHQNFYLIFMKTLFISATAYIIYLMKFEKPYCVSYDALGDDFKHWKFLVPAAFVLALIVHRNWTVTDYIWSFSIWLEAIAIFPQLHMLSKIREVENITANYVVALGIYRIFYIFNWIYRYIAEDYLCWTSVLGGILQTVMYGDFLYYYMKSRGKDIISLPV